MMIRKPYKMIKLKEIDFPIEHQDKRVILGKPYLIQIKRNYEFYIGIAGINNAYYFHVNGIGNFLEREIIYVGKIIDLEFSDRERKRLNDKIKDLSDQILKIQKELDKVIKAKKELE